MSEFGLPDDVLRGLTPIDADHAGVEARQVSPWPKPPSLQYICRRDYAWIRMLRFLRRKHGELWAFSAECEGVRLNFYFYYLQRHWLQKEAA